jgi:hypothetical protein
MLSKSRSEFRRVNSGAVASLNLASTLTLETDYGYVATPGARLDTDIVHISAQTPTTGIFFTGIIDPAAGDNQVAVVGINLTAGTVDPAASVMSVLTVRP